MYVWCHLIECNKKIRTVDKCDKCTRFYVYSNTIMSLIRNTTALDYLQIDRVRLAFEICSIFSGIKSKHVDLYVYYKASDFINHDPECVNFGSIFKDLIGKPLACFVVYGQVFVQIFFNQMRFIYDFTTFNYFRDKSDLTCQRFLEKTLMKIYYLHLKYLIKNVNGILRAESVNNFYECLVSGKIRYNKNQIEFTNG